MGSWGVAHAVFLYLNVIQWLGIFKSQQGGLRIKSGSCEAGSKLQDSVLKNGIGFAYSNVHGREKCDETELARCAALDHCGGRGCSIAHHCDHDRPGHQKNETTVDRLLPRERSLSHWHF